MLTKDEGGAATPLTAGKQVLCYSQTWDCASYVSLPGNIAHILFGIHNVLELINLEESRPLLKSFFFFRGQRNGNARRKCRSKP